jgi:hypothetical protein
MAKGKVRHDVTCDGMVMFGAWEVMVIDFDGDSSLAHSPFSVACFGLHPHGDVWCLGGDGDRF